MFRAVVASVTKKNRTDCPSMASSSSATYSRLANAIWASPSSALSRSISTLGCGGVAKREGMIQAASAIRPGRRRNETPGASISC
eukprot:scaffold3808_cov222-Pinguiococcus_pyrenoidosus.AAC.2